MRSLQQSGTRYGASRIARPVAMLDRVDINPARQAAGVADGGQASRPAAPSGTFAAARERPE